MVDEMATIWKLFGTSKRFFRFGKHKSHNFFFSESAGLKKRSNSVSLVVNTRVTAVVDGMVAGFIQTKIFQFEIGGQRLSQGHTIHRLHFRVEKKNPRLATLERTSLRAVAALSNA